MKLSTNYRSWGSQVRAGSPTSIVPNALLSSHERKLDRRRGRM
jgi:hypothetical protein